MKPNETVFKRNEAALSKLYSEQEILLLRANRERELGLYNTALFFVTLLSLGNNRLLRYVASLTPDFLSEASVTVIGASSHLGNPAQSVKDIIASKEIGILKDRMNGKSFMLDEDDKLVQVTGNLPDLFPRGQKDKWPDAVSLTCNSSLTSPRDFANSMFSARKAAKSYIEGPDKQERVVTIGGFSARTGFFGMIKNSVKRAHEIIKSGGRSTKHVDETSKLMLDNLLDLVSLRDNKGNILAKDGRRILRADSDEIMERVVGYGYSGAASKAHDIFRLLRQKLENGELAIDGSDINSTAYDAKVIESATLITAAGPNYSYQDAAEPRCFFFLSEKDSSVSFVRGVFKSKSVIIVDGGIELYGHDETSHVERINDYFTNLHQQEGGRI